MMKKEFQKRILSSLIIIPIALFFVAEGSVFFIFFLSIFFITTSYEWLKMIKKNNLIKIFGIIFLLISFYSTYLSREILGLNYFLFIILICISTDMGGYFFGKTFKGPKLTKISPNKTYAGALGSFILSIITGLIFNQYFASIDVSSKLSFLILILFISFL